MSMMESILNLRHLQYIKMDDIIKMVSKFGPGAPLAKFDIESAYRNIAIHPSDRHLLGFKWCNAHYIDLALPFVTSHAKTFLTVSRFNTDSHSPAVHVPFERTGMPFERLELSVLKNSSSVRTVQAIRSRKLISRSNGSSCPFEKNHQPFQRLKLSIQENSSAVRTAQAIHPKKIISRSNGSSYPFEKFISRSNGSSYPFEKFICRSNGSSCPCKKETSFFGSCSNKTRLQNNSPCFVK